MAGQVGWGEWSEEASWQVSGRKVYLSLLLSCRYLVPHVQDFRLRGCVFCVTPIFSLVAKCNMVGRKVRGMKWGSEAVFYLSPVWSLSFCCFEDCGPPKRQVVSVCLKQRPCQSGLKQILFWAGTWTPWYLLGNTILRPLETVLQDLMTDPFMLLVMRASKWLAALAP